MLVIFLITIFAKKYNMSEILEKMWQTLVDGDYELVSVETAKKIAKQTAIIALESQLTLVRGIITNSCNIHDLTSISNAIDNEIKSLQK